RRRAVAGATRRRILRTDLDESNVVVGDRGRLLELEAVEVGDEGNGPAKRATLVRALREDWQGAKTLSSDGRFDSNEGSDRGEEGRKRVALHAPTPVWPGSPSEVTASDLNSARRTSAHTVDALASPALQRSRGVEERWKEDGQELVDPASRLLQHTPPVLTCNSIVSSLRV
ncbi:LOW QUALITY PROTEIN: hypothetical protein RTBOTA2_003659, partial [Rhodotorula toruloides]